jgi:type II secretory pathway pseudopilin PulG
MVVAIIGILSAIAVPNFLESQARAKAARAKADLRTIATALESYSTDNNGHYPDDNPRSDLTGFLGAPQLTTPVAYVSSLKSIIDPFRRDLDLVPADADEAYRYWNAGSRAQGTNAPPSAANALDANGPWIVSSAGPDRVDQYPPTGDHQYETLPYDSTNGTISKGDIYRTHKTGQK